MDAEGFREEAESSMLPGREVGGHGDAVDGIRAEASAAMTA